MSQEGPLHPAVQRLLHTLGSIDHLEVLLLLEGDPQRAWSADDVAAVLFGDTRLTQRLLRELTVRGLLGRRVARGESDRYHYEPSTDTLGHSVAQLRDAYNQQPFVVIRALATQRAPAARSLADAFRIRRPPKDEGSLG